MGKRIARLVTVMISDYLDKYNVGLPSLYLETIEAKLIDGKFEEVFTFVENRLRTTKMY